MLRKCMWRHTKVRLEPVGVEFEVENGETVLNAAFRQGINAAAWLQGRAVFRLQMRALLDGEVDMLKYSTFALNDMEKDTGHILLCRSLAFSDMEVELLNYDEEVLSKAIAVKTFKGRISTSKR